MPHHPQPAFGISAGQSSRCLGPPFSLLIPFCFGLLLGHPVTLSMCKASGQVQPPETSIRLESAVHIEAEVEESVPLLVKVFGFGQGFDRDSIADHLLSGRHEENVANSDRKYRSQERKMQNGGIK